MIRAEIEHRYDGRARIEYVDVADESSLSDHGEMLGRIGDRHLIYPVTVVDGTPMCDGAVSYPAILRAIETKIAESLLTDAAPDSPPGA